MCRLPYCLLLTLSFREFHRLLITFANSLDPDQDQHSVGQDLDFFPFDTYNDSACVPERFFIKKLILKTLVSA